MKKCCFVVFALIISLNNLNAWAKEWWCKSAEGWWYNPALKHLSEACQANATKIGQEYQKLINQLQNEVQKAVANPAYKPNLNIKYPTPNYCQGSMFAILSAMGCKTYIEYNGVKRCYGFSNQYLQNAKVCIPGKESGISLCNDNFNAQRQKCLDSLNKLHQDFRKAIEELKNSISKMGFNYNETFEPDDSNYSSGGGSGDSSSSGNSSGAGSGSNNSNSSNNPYGSNSSSGGSVNRSAGANENQSFNAFQQQVKQGANTDNNIVKGKKGNNQNNKTSASQGDTSFYDVVGERPPASQGIRD